MRYLGQHFLRNKNIVKKIADLAELSKGDVVLEVGPGKGVLTEELLNRTVKVVAVEKDRELCEFLRDKFREEVKEGRLVLVEGDILKIFNFQFSIFNEFSSFKFSKNMRLSFPRKRESKRQDIFSNFLDSRFCGNDNRTHSIIPNKKYKIVANIPYYITSRFLKIFLEEAGAQPQKMVLMVQKEVAERICETPLRLRQGYGGQAKKSLLAVSVQVYGTPKLAFKVSAGNFSPPPKVDSAVLLIDNISKEWFNGIKEDEFFAAVKAGFSKKRKILINNLSDGLKISKPEMEEVFNKCGISLKARAEELGLAEWKCLVREIRL